MNKNSSQSRAVGARPAKRQRIDGDQRLQRKREADRLAQKNSRERQKSHVDHLENMISILRKENGNAATCELVETVRQLRSENERLRRIINGAKTALSFATGEPTPSSPKPMADNNVLGIVLENGSQNSRVEGRSNKDSESSASGIRSAKDSILNVKPRTSNNLTQNMTLVREECQDSLANSAHSNLEGILNFTDAWMDGMVDASRTRRRRPDLDPLSWLSPHPITMPSAARPSEGAMQCQIWQKSNEIYSQISKVSRACASAALNLNATDYANLIFKAVINGWASLSIEERSNPIIQTLGDIDQVFLQLDQISRAAFLYKSHMLLKYLLNPEKQNWEKMPEWLRPLLSQQTKQHPIAIDFFVWPALRDRLIWNSHNYFATSDFSLYFSRYYKFSWPFSFQDAYVYDEESDTYRITPLFERYHRNIRYWGVEKPFLERFPELTQDITSLQIDTDPLNPGFHRFGAMGNSSERAVTADKAHYEAFSDCEITELFNDCPQVA